MFIFTSSLLACPLFGLETPTWIVGAAKVDIIPDYPVLLNGYGGASRRVEVASAEQHRSAKAIAFGSDGEQPALLLTVDSCGA